MMYELFLRCKIKVVMDIFSSYIQVMKFIVIYF